MSEYEIAEEQGRKQFEQFAKREKLEIIHFTPHYEHYDVLFISGGTEWLGEVKIRHCRASKYPNYILEKSKVENIKSNFPDKKIMYINFFEDVTLCWDITNLNLPIHKKQLPATTATKTKIKTKLFYLLSK